jgi:hypothetical protein
VRAKGKEGAKKKQKKKRVPLLNSVGKIREAEAVEGRRNSPSKLTVVDPLLFLFLISRRLLFR